MAFNICSKGKRSKCLFQFPFLLFCIIWRRRIYNECFKLRPVSVFCEFRFPHWQNFPKFTQSYVRVYIRFSMFLFLLGQSIGTLRCMKNETLKEAMEEPHSVSSPRRILSLSKKKRASVSFSDPDDKASGFGLSGEHGPKPSEVYGFVGSITTVVATVIFFTWAYVPEHWLHAVGIYYYPSRYWALAVPTYIVVTVALALAFYIGLNFLSTPPPTSLNTLFDEFTRDPSIFGPLGEGDELPIEPLSDIPIDEINRLMFDDVN